MARQILVMVGTKKGVFILESDVSRRDWSMRGPFCETWPINHVVGNPATGAIHAGGGDAWFGPAVWTSTDLGESWTHSSEGLKYAEGEEPIASVWSINADNGVLYAGVQPAGLFRSDDQGRTWRHLDGLQKHPTRDRWMAGGAGLTLHHIVVDPNDDNRIWVGISSAGVFYSADGGETWEPRNRGTRADFLPEGENYPEFGQCVHSLALAAGSSERLYQQNHCGMYRTDDGGRTWLSIEEGLPSSFGFPSAAHPSDPDTIFLAPLNGDTKGRFVPDARAAVWVSRDAGRSWKDLRKGLPQKNAYFGVLRQAMATDGEETAGVYFGSSSGTLFASADEGASWHAIAEHLPTIHSVETLTVER